MTTRHVARHAHRCRTRRCVAAVLVALATVIVAAPARAQIAVDRLELFLRPTAPDGRSGLLMVRNEGSERSQAVVKVEDWDRATDGTNRFFAAGTQPGSCASALRVFPSTLSLAPGESQAIRVDIDSASAGRIRAECWNVVIVQAQQPVKQAGGRTLLYTLRTGMKVYVTPDGLTAEGEVTDLQIEAAARGDTGAAPKARVTFRNTGALHVAAQGRLEIRREDNSLVAVAALPAMHALPGAEAVVTVRLPACPPGRYTVVAIVDYGGAELAAGELEHEIP
ncbi:MAG: molecular chaperone [Gemmatimonadaceae bacterium]|nr:molecular chaperone [Gemmatimonadaceae bacterium]